ncbi:hypothetical protein M9458_052519 [Cirrhinus mrigala]|uniref:Uncharacterized protein n=1 Tax=Cirrhinus mrigala TaxID=683832 RepID=A0ABD0MW57_CIRMR
MKSVLEEVSAEDRHPGGGRTKSRVDLTEGGAMEETEGSKVDQTEGGAKENIEGTRSRRNQVSATMAAHGRADRGRSHGGGRADDSRGPTNSGGASGGEARGGDGEPMIQGDTEDPEGQGGAQGSGN